MTPGINHNILSPAFHVATNRDKYWGYVIGVDARTGDSILTFKTGDSRGSKKYDQNSNDTTIKRTYENLFQCVTMPCVSDMCNHTVLTSGIRTVTDTKQMMF